ncbi:unnamed protein product [Ceutorhynchus assimilis]|uniref:Chitin-binding type-2 domain-containing protein n=1 Tax=Ceutorhynchus assimilis TaxID=467358 RepID=A0A9P0DN81_9CUCU|nr:unnamed protein product [Ceutorhynchus assimilis]
MLEFWNFFVVFLGAGFSVFGVTTQPIHKTSFSCDGRTSGYYADVGSGCQVYHMCDGLGRQFSYKCPKNTLFQQRMLICDHWYMVNCSKSEEDYSANLLIGQQGKAFIEDLQFQRTPRPDLAGTDFNLYRTTQGAISTKNLVGAEESDSHLATDEYFPPSHWSTEFSAPSTTPAPRKREESDTGVSGLTKQVFYSTNYRTGKRFLSKKGKDATNSINRVDNSEATRSKVKTDDSEKSLPSGVNFPSRFKATTPVYPKDLGIDVSKFTDFANAPEESESNNNNKNPIVNFPSNYQGTTPVYPKEVDIDLSKFSGYEDIAPGQKKSGEEVVVNFPSDFKATTPIYPKKVDVDLSKFSGSEVVSPSDSSDTTNVVVNFASNFKATTPVYPKEVDVDLSKFYGPEETGPGETGDYDNVVNFASGYKGTTPVYPLDAGIDSSKYSGIEELPPKQSDQDYKDDVIVNFASNFKATTPVYPKEVNIDLSKFGEPEEIPAEKSNGRTTVDFVANYTEATTPDYPPNDNIPGSIPEDFGLLPPRESSDSQSAANNDLFGLVPPRQEVDNKPTGFLPPRQDNVKRTQTINFGSNYQATTPVYPESVEPSSPDPNDIGLLAPKSNIEYSLPSQDIQPPSFESTFKKRIDEEDLSLLGNTFSSQQLNRFMVTIRPEQLREIQELWRIPEYDFPLDSAASRPSYESHYSSFQANRKAVKNR